MIIVFRGYGNHSNRLFQAINIEAFCIENKVDYLNPSFKDMSKYYGIKNNFFDPAICFLMRIFKKIKLIKTLDFNNFDQNELYSNTILKKRLIFAQGWCFRAHGLTKKYQDYLIGKYSLLPDLYIENDLYKYFITLDRNEYIIIGVHIRRGDYKYWENGKYYFTDDIYQMYMNSISSELKKRSNKKIKFILFSNENININRTEDIIVSNNEWYIEQLIMSKCDYLIGPPSTFTLWASYIGRVKYYQIKDNTGNIDINDFSYCLGLEK
ncbi:MAG TPA: alpha-1,2-fucosyltransferase [Candidatus Paceibacterota bacterium]